MVLTSTLLYLTTCCRSDSAALRTIDPSIAKYIIEFKAEMEQRGALPTWAPLPLAITYGTTPYGTIGVCYLPANIVIIDESLQRADEYKRKSTIFHELTHCMSLILTHSDDPGAIMYHEHMESDFSRWGEQMDDLADFIKQHSPIYKIMRDQTAPLYAPGEH